MLISGDHIRSAKGTKSGAENHLNILREKIRRALPKAKKAVLVMGLPGSGKSTAARGLDSRTSLVIDTCALTALHRRTKIAHEKAAREPNDCCEEATDATTCALGVPLELFFCSVPPVELPLEQPLELWVSARLSARPVARPVARPSAQPLLLLVFPSHVAYFEHVASQHEEMCMGS